MQRTIWVEERDLPIHCPSGDTASWNMHPRVFVPLSHTSPRWNCPYCGAAYELRKVDSSEKETASS